MPEIFEMGQDGRFGIEIVMPQDRTKDWWIRYYSQYTDNYYRYVLPRHWIFCSLR